MKMGLKALVTDAEIEAKVRVPGVWVVEAYDGVGTLAFSPSSSSWCEN